MDSNRWKRIEKALDELLDLEPQDRESRLDGLSGGDAELRADLERLLAADDDERTGILDQGMAPLAGALLDPEQEPSRASGERIGPYRVLGVLGSGGMGEVLLAERADGAFDRRIALKVVPGDRVREELVARLRHERQILARLRHPNIAALYDGGVTDAGAPYFAMELVKGESIIDYADRAQLGVDARLELFDRVCQAVQFAHRNLVIHRDIKPSNVFVTNDGEVKLLDFGIAKLVDDGEVTSAEQRFLTPAFAAPEQLKGEPTTTAVDIYALGLLLYELLSGRRPFGRKRDSASMMQAVLQDAPTPLSRITGKDASPEDTLEIARQRGLTVESLRRQLRGDLDTILDKALRKDPGERYASAEGLRLDLLRYRSSQPVTARPATAGYKLRKFIRRNRLGVSLGALALVAGIVFSAWIGLLYSRAERNLSRATAAEISTAREAETLRQVSYFLTELFEVASPDASSGRDVTAREMLDAGAARIEEELDTEPHVRASLQLTMAASYRWLGRYEDALALAESSSENRRELFGEESLEYAMAQAEIGWLQLYLGQLTEAEKTTRSALRIFEATLEPNDLNILEAHSALGSVMINQGKFSEAEPVMARVLAIQESAPEPNAESIALASNDLGAVYTHSGRLDEAAALFGRAIEAHYAVGDSTHPSLATYMSNLGDARLRQGHYEEAEDLMLRALTLATSAFGPDNVDLAERRNALGKLYKRLGRLEEAEEQLLRSIEIWRAHVPGDNLKVLWVLDSLIGVYIDAGRLVEADSISTDVVRMSTDSVGETSVFHGMILFTHADLREAQDRWREAGDLRMEAIRVYEGEYGPSHKYVANRVLELARNRRQLDLLDEAEQLFSRALAIFEEIHGFDSEEATGVREELSTLRG